MGFGTGGANVSIDNLVSAYRGLDVWNTNTQIDKYVKNEDYTFQSNIALRALYGFGDEEQRALLFEILGEEIKVLTEEGEGLSAQTVADKDGNRTITITGYRENMSFYEQLRISAIFGHEAYRDGYKPGQYDANGNFITQQMQDEEFKTASIARILMSDRIDQDYQFFYINNLDLAYESALFNYAKTTGDYAILEYYWDTFYDNTSDNFFIKTVTGGDFQNSGSYNSIPLLLAKSKEQVDEKNEENKLKAYEEYEKEMEGKDEPILSYDEFIKDKNTLDKYYKAENYISLGGYGCKLFSIKYILENIHQKQFDAVDFNNNILESETFNNTYINTSHAVDILNRHAEGHLITYVEYKEGPTIDELYKLHLSNEKFSAVLQVPGVGTGVHFVSVTNIEFTFDENRVVNGIKQVNVANPWNPVNSSIGSTLGHKSYTIDQIKRWDIFKIETLSPYMPKTPGNNTVFDINKILPWRTAYPYL
jgi:hypothetical protein